MTTFGVDIIYNSVGITDYFVVIMPHILRVTTGRYGMRSPVEYRIEIVAGTIHVSPLILGIHQFDRSFTVE